MSEIAMDESKMKALLKAAIIEVIEENQDFVREVLQEALEDIAITRAIEEGEHTSNVSRKEIFEVLRGEQ